MDYTTSANFATSLVTGKRMHQNTGLPTTRVTKSDLNSIYWELLRVIEGAGITPIAFDEGVPASYSQLQQAITAMVVALLPAAVVATDTVRGQVRLNLGTDMPGDANNAADALTSAGLIGVLGQLLPNNALQTAVLRVPVPLATVSPTMVAAGVADFGFDIIDVSTAAGTFNITLPASTTLAKRFQIITWKAGTVPPTLVAAAGETVDGASIATIYYAAPAPGAYATFQLMPVSGGWRIV